MELKVFSWNMYCKNRNFDGALKFLQSIEADVMCLQEVPTEIAREMKKVRGWHVTEAKARHRGRKRIKTRNVIVSKYPVKSKGGDAFADEEKRAIKSRISGLCGPLEFQYIDIKVGSRKVRIFNSHLECNTSPRMRVEQFKQVLDLSHKSSVNIYCGDLNTYGQWYLNIFVGYISNYKLADITQSEKKLFRELFKEHQLHNVFHGQVTYPLFQLQLDHILIPDDMKVVDKQVYKKRYGSDHRPICVEVEV
jgi:endonuclease/exonuclease/phosphatase family metal-dependent hydrolase